MADVLVKPAFVSLATDSGDVTKLGPNAWNAARLFSDGTEGQIVVRRAASATGAAWEAPGAAAAGTLTGAALAANVLASSLTSVGTLVGLTVGVGSGSATATPVGTLNSQFTPVSNTSIGSEDVLFTFTLPANTLAVNGKGVRITAAGMFAATANSKSAKMYFGAMLVAGTNFVTSSPNGLPWRLTADIVRTGATAQITSTLSGVGAIGAWYTHNVTPAETLSGTVAIQVRGLSAVAATDVTAKLWIVEAF